MLTVWGFKGLGFKVSGQSLHLKAQDPQPEPRLYTKCRAPDIILGFLQGIYKGFYRVSIWCHVGSSLNQGPFILGT